MSCHAVVFAKLWAGSRACRRKCALGRNTEGTPGYSLTVCIKQFRPFRTRGNLPGIAGHDKELANAAHMAVVPWFGAGARSSRIETACTLGQPSLGGDKDEDRATADDKRAATAADSRSDRSRRYPVRSGGPAGLAMNPCSAWGAVYPTDTRRARRRS